MAKRGFGSIRRLPSKRWQARYTGPDTATHSAPSTFETRDDAEAWLVDRRREIADGTWSPDGPARATLRTLGSYAEGWLAARTLKPRTREHYRRLLDSRILPTFAAMPVRSITPDKIRDWHTGLGAGQPTLRAHAYSLLRSILHDAVADGLIAANPCHIRGAGNSKRVHRIKPASLAELELLVGAMPERYRVMTLLAAWCGLRFGELAELRRTDLDMKHGVIHVRRGVVRAGGEALVGTPKSAAGHRDVAIPPHLLALVREHLTRRVNGRSGLLFPAADGVVAHRAQHALQGVLPGPRGRRAPRSPLARPEAHRGRPRGVHRRHAGRTDVTPGAFNRWCRVALPTRSREPRRDHRSQVVRASGGAR